MIRLMSIIISLIMNGEAYANGDPVAKFSSVNRVANPEPLSISEIYITSEQINITHIDGYNCFDVTYTLKNKSDKNFPEINYGFPIDYLVADELETYRFTDEYYSESIYEIGWNEKLIKDIEFTYNGAKLPFHSSKESVRESELLIETDGVDSDSIPIHAINRRWFYTAFAMSPYAEATLNVRYKVYANSYVDLGWDTYDFSYFARKTNGDNNYYGNIPFAYRYFTDKFKILYDFAPAKHFGNDTPYGIDVDIDLSNLDNPCIRTDDGYYCYTSHIQKYIYDKVSSSKPIDLTVSFKSDHSEKSLTRIINQLKIPETEFEINMTGDTVSVAFHKPMFVSDVVCDIDADSVKSINSLIEYADGSKKEYIYEPVKKHNKIDRRIKSPVLLTITDLYNDGIIRSGNSFEFVSQTSGFDKDKFKIKNIKLVFNTDSITDTVCRGLTVLDCRF